MQDSLLEQLGRWQAMLLSLRAVAKSLSPWCNLQGPYTSIHFGPRVVIWGLLLPTFRLHEHMYPLGNLED